MEKKFKREYKLEFRKPEVQPGIGIFLGLKNDQPKKMYRTANWDMVCVFLCFSLVISLKYNYKSQPK